MFVLVVECTSGLNSLGAVVAATALTTCYGYGATMSKMWFSQICLRLFPTLAHFLATASLGLGAMQARDLAPQLDQQLSLHFGVRGDAHPHQSYLVPTANAREIGTNRHGNQTRARMQPEGLV